MTTSRMPTRASERARARESESERARERERESTERGGERGIARGGCGRIVGIDSHGQCKEVVVIDKGLYRGDDRGRVKKCNAPCRQRERHAGRSHRSAASAS